MSVLFPHRQSSTIVVGLILIDLPILVAVLVVGFFNGFGKTYTEINDWRLAHPWSFIPSIIAVVVLLIKWRKSKPKKTDLAEKTFPLVRRMLSPYSERDRSRAR